jgi:hypothetical protein
METTNRSEYDLTAAVDNVVRRLYKGLQGDGPEFDDLDALTKKDLRESVLPIVVATLNYEDEKAAPLFIPGRGRPDLDLLHRLLQMIDLNEDLGAVRHQIDSYLKHRPDTLPHVPHRGDDVAEWVKRRRDEYAQHGASSDEWTALDDLLDDYRLHADTGTPLSEDVPTPGGETA